MSNTSGFADYLIVATGDSNTHMRALSDRVRKAMSSEGATIQHAEGRESPNWILLDYSSVVINILSRKARDYYALETLWGDSEQTRWDETASQASSFG